MIKIITKSYINRKCRQALKNINTGLDFPVAVNMVKKVLVFLPKDLQLLEEANSFSQQLRQTYDSWTVDIFDVEPGYTIGAKDINKISVYRFTDLLIERLETGSINGI